MISQIPRHSSLLDKIVKVALNLWKKIFKSKSAKEISEENELNEDNINSVINYNKLINNFVEEVEKIVIEFEQNIISECMQYYDELLILIEAVEQSKNLNLNSKRIRRYIQRLLRNNRGSLCRIVSKKISLDNSELKKILELQSGDLKRKKLEKFKSEIIKKSIEEFSEDLRARLSEFSDDISEELNNVLSDLSGNNERILNELTLIEQSKKDNNEKIKTLKELIEIRLRLCNEILKEMGI